MSTPFAPLGGLQTLWDNGDTAVTITLYLLDPTVTTMLDSYATASELPGLLATGGGYDSTVGIAAGEWPLNYDSTAGVMELSLPDASWASAGNYDLTFRWIAITMTGGIILTAADFGSGQSLTGGPLSIYAAESTAIPNSYPIFRLRKA